MAITDLRVIREPHERKENKQEGQYMNRDQQSVHSETTFVDEDPYDKFRSHEPNPDNLTRVVRDTETYNQVPSKYVSCRLTKSVFSSFNKSDVPGNGHPGLKDTRFGNSHHPSNGPNRDCHQSNVVTRHIDWIHQREANRRGGRGVRGGYRGSFGDRGGRVGGKPLGRGVGHWSPRPERNDVQMDLRMPADLMLPPVRHGLPMPMHTIHPAMVPFAQNMPWGPTMAMGAHPWYFHQPTAFMQPTPPALPHHWFHPQLLGSFPPLSNGNIGPSTSFNEYGQPIHAIPDVLQYSYEPQYCANTPNQEPHIEYDQRPGMSNASRSFPVTPLNPNAEDFLLPDIAALKDSGDQRNYGVVHESMGLNPHSISAPGYPPPPRMGTASVNPIDRRTSVQNGDRANLAISASGGLTSEERHNLVVYIDEMNKSAMARGESFLMGDRASAGIGRLDQFNVAVHPPTPNMQPSSLRDANEAKHDLYKLSMGRIPLPENHREMSELELIEAAEDYLHRSDGSASWADTANANNKQASITRRTVGTHAGEKGYVITQRNDRPSSGGEGSSIAQPGWLPLNGDVSGNVRTKPLNLEGMDNRIFGVKPGTVSAPVSAAVSRDPSPFRHSGVIGEGRADRSTWLPKK